MTGIVIVVESSRVIDSALSIEEATKLVVSAGLVVPRKKEAAIEAGIPVASWAIPDSVAMAGVAREMEKGAEGRGRAVVSQTWVDLREDGTNGPHETNRTIWSGRRLL